MTADQQERELLSAYVRARPSTCPRCGYSLTDLPGKVCPECGAVMRLELVAGAALPATFPLRIQIGWLLCVNVVVIAGAIYTMWLMFEPLLKMSRSLGQPAPRFTGFLAQSLASVQGLALVGCMIAIGPALYSLIELRSADQVRIGRARRICIGLLGLHVVVLAVAFL